MPGVPTGIIAAEIQRKRQQAAAEAARKEAAQKANAKTATQKASSQNVTQLVNMAKSGTNKSSSAKSTNKPTKGVLAAQIEARRAQIARQQRYQSHIEDVRQNSRNSLPISSEANAKTPTQLASSKNVTELVNTTRENTIANKSATTPNTKPSNNLVDSIINPQTHIQTNAQNRTTLTEPPNPTFKQVAPKNAVDQVKDEAKSVAKESHAEAKAQAKRIKEREVAKENEWQQAATFNDNDWKQLVDDINASNDSNITVDQAKKYFLSLEPLSPQSNQFLAYQKSVLDNKQAKWKAEYNDDALLLAQQMGGGVLRSVGGLDKALGGYVNAQVRAASGGHDGITKNWMEEGIVGHYFNQAAESLGLRGIDEQIAYNAAPLAYESKGMQAAGMVAEGIGEMLPFMIPGGAASEAGSVASKAAEVGKLHKYVAGVLESAKNPGLIAMGMSVMGSGTSQALREGASTSQALSYGILEGAKEYATELPFGGIPFLGKGVISPAIGETKSLAGKFAKEFVEIGGEGIEEVMSAIAEPFVANATYKDGETMPSIKDLAAQGLTGILVSGILKGVVSSGGIVVNSINKSDVTAPVSSMDFLRTLQTQLQQMRQTATEEEIPKIEKATASLSEIIAYQSATESENPAQAIHSYVADGTLTQDQGNSLWQLINSAAARNDEGLPTSTEANNERFFSEPTDYDNVDETDIENSRLKFDRQWRYKNEEQGRGWLISERKGEKKYEQQPDAETTLNDREFRYDDTQTEPNLDVDRKTSAEAKSDLLNGINEIVNALPGHKKEFNAFIKEIVDESLKTGRPNRAQIRQLFNDIYPISATIKRMGQDVSSAQNILKGTRIYVGDLDYKKLNVAKSKANVQFRFMPGKMAVTKPTQAGKALNKPYNLFDIYAVLHKAYPALFPEGLSAQEQADAIISVAYQKNKITRNIDKDNDILQNDVLHDDMFENQTAYQERLDKFEQDIEGAFSDFMGAVYHEPAKVLTELPQNDNASLKEKMDQSWLGFRQYMEDSFASIRDFSYATKDNSIYESANNVRKSQRRGEQVVIGSAQRDINGNIVGDSLSNIFKPLFDYAEMDSIAGTQKLSDFYYYLMHYQNIDTPGVIFGKEVTSRDSQNAIAELNAKYSDFSAMAEKVWRYNDNNLQYALDTGLISPEHAANMRHKNPHYVPARRVIDESADYGQGRGMFKQRLGSYRDIKPIYEQMADQTLWLYREGSINGFLNDFIKRAIDNPDIGRFWINNPQTEDGEFNYTNGDEHDPHKVETTSKGSFTVYINGQQTRVNVPSTAKGSGLIFAINDMRGSSKDWENLLLIRGWRAFNNVEKALITSWNPKFAARNFFRDMQEAGFYAKNEADFIRNYPKAWQQIATNGELWQLYKDMGGLSSSYFDFSSRGLKKSNVAQKVGDAVESLNIMVEQAPRFTEFISELERNGGNITRENLNAALYAADEATVNFGQSGVLARYINRYGVWFFNPAIQGLSRFARNIHDNGFTSGGIARLVVRAAILGIGPEVLQQMIAAVFGDDDKEYLKDIAEGQKDIYWYIPNFFTADAGDFIKIPKSRENAILGNTLRRAYDSAEGDKSAWSGYGEGLVENLAPNNPVTGNVFAPFIQAGSNKSWNNAPIVPSYMEQNLNPADQYDETTTILSKWIAKMAEKKGVELSPKKLDYIANAYGGSIWDTFAPMMTETAADGLFKGAFTADVFQSNKYSQQFYDAYDKVRRNANDPDLEDDTEASLNYKYASSVYDQVSNLTDLKHDIQGDETLSNKQKNELIDSLNKQIYGLQKQYLEHKDEVAERLGDATINSDKDLYNNAIAAVFGEDYHFNTATEMALKTLEDAGVSNESMIDYYQKSIKSSAKDAKAAETALTDYDIPISTWFKVSKGLSGLTTAGKRNYVLNYGLSDEQTVYILDNKVFTNSDSAKSLANELQVDYGIPAIETYRAYSRYWEINKAEGRKPAAEDLDLYLRDTVNTLTADQKKMLAESLDKNGFWTELEVDYNFDKDSLSPAFSKTMAKYLTPALDSGLTRDEYIYAYSFLSKVKSDAPISSYVAQVNQLDLTAAQKAIILNARYIKGYSKSQLTDGGNIVVKGKQYGQEKYSVEEKTNNAKFGNTMADYVPPSSRPSGIPQDKNTTIVSGDYKVTVENNIARFNTTSGSTVVSPMDGKVIAAKRTKYNGIIITVQFDDGSRGYYTGLSGRGVEYGDEVKAGQTIGSTGATMSFTYKDATGKPLSVKDNFDIVGGSGTIETDEDYFSTQTSKSYDNFSGYGSGWHSYGYGGYGGYLANKVYGGKSKYSRYSYSGWPGYSYTGNENKKS